MTTINRRAVIKAAPAAALTAALPTLASAEPESEIMRLFAQCCAMNAGIGAVRRSADETAAMVAELCELEAAMVALPARSLRDLAAKVHVWNAYGAEGGFGCDLDEPIMAEIAALLTTGGPA